VLRPSGRYRVSSAAPPARPARAPVNCASPAEQDQAIAEVKQAQPNDGSCSERTVAADHHRSRVSGDGQAPEPGHILTPLSCHEIRSRKARNAWGAAGWGLAHSLP
jgi:hypothetical protein